MTMFAILASSGATATVSRLFWAVLFVIGALWLLLRYLHFQNSRISLAWQNLAAELEFAYRPARGPAFRRKSEEIEGVIDGQIVRLTRYGLSPGLDSAVYTRWSAELSPKPDFVLYVHGKHSLSRLATLLGYEDLEVGDPEFDRRWSTKSDDLARVRQVLTPEVRAAIAKLKAACVVLNETGANIVWSGQVVALPELRAGLDALKSLLKALGDTRSEHPPVGKNAGSSEAKPSEKAESSPRPSPIPEPPEPTDPFL